MRALQRAAAAIAAALLSLVGLSGAASAQDPIGTFHKAVHMGDLRQVQAMLADDPKLAISTDRFGFQPVHLLDMYFEAAILDALLANGADVNARNDEGVTILHLVTEPEAVPILVAKGADREARDQRGWTPLLMQANERDRADVVTALVAAGADPGAKGTGGETALSFARQGNDAELVRILTRAGARE